MKRLSLPVVALLTIAACAKSPTPERSLEAKPAAIATPPAPAWARDAAIEQRVEALLAKMTLEEKIGQLNMLTADLAVTGPGMPADYMAELKKGRLGSMLNLFGAPLMRSRSLSVNFPHHCLTLPRACFHFPASTS